MSTKHIFELRHPTTKRSAVIVEETPELAKLRASLIDGKGQWNKADVLLLSRIDATRIEK